MSVAFQAHEYLREISDYWLLFRSEIDFAFQSCVQLLITFRTYYYYCQYLHLLFGLLESSAQL
jgi:hypothetical protein